jgi:hypothetical protein
MKRWIAMAPLAGSLLAGGVAAEGFLNGEGLHDLCNDDAACTAYVMGVSDAIDMTSADSGVGSPYCAPEVESDQATQLVAKYLKRHPAKWSSPAPTLVVAALAEEFPCGKQDE